MLNLLLCIVRWLRMGYEIFGLDLLKTEQLHAALEEEDSWLREVVVSVPVREEARASCAGLPSRVKEPSCTSYQDSCFSYVCSDALEMDSYAAFHVEGLVAACVSPVTRRPQNQRKMLSHSVGGHPFSTVRCL